MALTEADITQLLLEGAAPPDMVEVPEGFNAVTVFAQEESGTWLPALTLRVNVSDISADNWRRPLRLAVRGETCNFPAL